MEKIKLNYLAPMMQFIEAETNACLTGSLESDGIEDATYGDAFDNWS